MRLLSPLFLSRTYLIAANWKMNPTPEGALSDSSSYRKQENIDVLVFPTFLDIHACKEAGIPLGGQFGNPESSGAFTGDISMNMLKEAGCTHVLCGHSERRQYHGETDEYVAQQARTALSLGMHPVICIGETETERDTGEAESVVSRQMSVLPLEENITLAYEPIWAIGTGNTATPELAQEMHALIRSLLPDSRKETTRILYGGSMKPENAKELLSQLDIDGGLIGGASLKPDAFQEMITIAKSF